MADVRLFRKSIDAAEEATQSKGFIALKLTALAFPQLLLHLSERIVETRNFFEDITGHSLGKLIVMNKQEQDAIFKVIYCIFKKI